MDDILRTANPRMREQEGASRSVGAGGVSAGQVVGPSKESGLYPTD